MSVCQVKAVLTDQRIGGVMLAPTRRPDIVLQMESENSTDKVFTGKRSHPMSQVCLYEMQYIKPQLSLRQGQRDVPRWHISNGCVRLVLQYLV